MNISFNFFLEKFLNLEKSWKIVQCPPHCIHQFNHSFCTHCSLLPSLSFIGLQMSCLLTPKYLVKFLLVTRHCVVRNWASPRGRSGLCPLCLDVTCKQIWQLRWKKHIPWKRRRTETDMKRNRKCEYSLNLS